MIMLNHNLRIFITAAELKNLTEAARKLYISQPAVSQAIKKLEEELQVNLFYRDKRSSLHLTEAGKDILAIAYKMADLENRLYQRAYEENHMMGGLVRIASVPVGMSIFLARVLPVFRKHFPDVEIELLEGTPLEVKNMVLSYQADLGITTSPYLGLSHRLLVKDRMVSVSRDKAATIDLRDRRDDLILCRVAKDSINEQLASQKVDLSHCQVVEAASTQINMVENENGIGIISELMLSTIPNQLVRGTVLPVVNTEISLIAHDFQELPSSAKELAEMIIQRSPRQNSL